MVYALLRSTKIKLEQQKEATQRDQQFQTPVNTVNSNDSST